MTNYEILRYFSDSIWISALITIPIFIVISLPVSVIYVTKNKNVKSEIIISISIIQYFIMIEYYMGISTGVMLVDQNKINAMSEFTVFYLTDFSTYYFYMFCPCFCFFIFSSPMSDIGKVILSLLNLSLGLSFRTIFYHS
jgi:hypothetical protein